MADTESTPSAARPDTSQQQAAVSPHRIVQAEANLLRFPFFALHTKGLRDRQAIQVLGTKTDDEGQRYEFSLRVSRNSEMLFPGPLSRKLHFAFLSILAEQGDVPFANPVVWSWRDLNARIGDKWCGSRTIDNYKTAIAATHGAVITTNDALMFKSEAVKKPLPRRTKGYHLYERYDFVGELADDGGLAAANRLWLADWYLANLNALYSGPLKYDVWMKLNAQSPVASRLYEYLLFHARVPQIRINYPYLASFLPVTPHVHRSRAEQQLNPAFDLLRHYHIIDDVQWLDSRSGILQLVIDPGSGLRRNRTRQESTDGSFASGDMFDSLRVVEVRNNETPEAEVVRRYHLLRFDKSNHRPQPSELAFARDILASYDQHTVLDLLPKLATVMQKEFPKGKTFNATRSYLTDLLDAAIRDVRNREQRAREAAEQATEDATVTAQKQARAERLAQLRNRWNELTDEEKGSIADQAIATANSAFLRNRLTRRKNNLDDPATEFLRQLSENMGVGI